MLVRHFLLAAPSLLVTFGPLLETKKTRQSDSLLGYNLYFLPLASNSNLLEATGKSPPDNLTT